MNKVAFLSLILIASINTLSQDTSDVERLRKMNYMELQDRVDCENPSGTNVEQKICLNLEFQHLDSIMNTKFIELLNRASNDSVRSRLRNYQTYWVENRRLQSEIMSDGYQGNMLGIIYLSCMVRSTQCRIEELEAILRPK